MVNDWVKKAVILYFPIAKMETIEVGPFEFHDKIPLKRDYAAQGVRVVPHAIALWLVFLEQGVILMPSYVNIGACRQRYDGGYLGYGGQLCADRQKCTPERRGRYRRRAGTALSGARHIEDGAFIGSRCIIVEGVHVEKEAVLGANVVLDPSTHIIDVTGTEPVTHKGRVPACSVVYRGLIPRSSSLVLIKCRAR
ncbi:MAG: DapH/DapD/GlmU-related protein [Saprospiraceae bacterium]